jgi:hypothetical protein
MFFAQAAVGPRFMAFFSGAGLVTRLGHLALLPQSIMLAAVALSKHMTIAIARLASSFVSHSSPFEIDDRSGVREQLKILL